MQIKQIVLCISKFPEEYSGPTHIEIPEGGGSIGRSSGSTVVLSDHNRFISGSHCLLTLYGDTYYISDVSTNGTLVNGERIIRNQPVSLQDGDSLVLGRYEISIAIEHLVRHLDIAMDIAPERDSTDPLIGLGKELVVEDQDIGTIEQLFMETHSSQNDSCNDPVSHLHFSMQADDDFLLKEEDSNAMDMFAPEVTLKQYPDDSFNIHSQFEAPNMIPEDWMSESQEIETSSHSFQTENDFVEDPLSTLQEDPSASHKNAGSKQNNGEVNKRSLEVNNQDELWESIPEISSVSSLNISKVMTNQTLSENTVSDELAGHFFKGLGISEPSLLASNPAFFEQMGSCLKLCISKLQKELEQVESFKKLEGEESVPQNLIELMLTLHQQTLLSPSELIEQMLDELYEHKKRYDSALHSVIAAELQDFDPKCFQKNKLTLNKFVTKRTLWKQYEDYYYRKIRSLNEPGSGISLCKIKEQYNKSLKVSDA